MFLVSHGTSMISTHCSPRLSSFPERYFQLLNSILAILLPMSLSDTRYPAVRWAAMTMALTSWTQCDLRFWMYILRSATSTKAHILLAVVFAKSLGLQLWGRWKARSQRGRKLLMCHLHSCGTCRLTNSGTRLHLWPQPQFILNWTFPYSFQLCARSIETMWPTGTQIPLETRSHDVRETLGKRQCRPKTWCF